MAQNKDAGPVRETAARSKKQIVLLIAGIAVLLTAAVIIIVLKFGLGGKDRDSAGDSSSEIRICCQESTIPVEGKTKIWLETKDKTVFGASADILWSVDSSDTAEVVLEGDDAFLIGKAKGKVTLKAEYRGASDSVTITVE